MMPRGLTQLNRALDGMACVVLNGTGGIEEEALRERLRQLPGG
ncbi:MAG TPA: hypothetical protein VF501_10165 [Thiobacillus sp.]